SGDELKTKVMLNSLQRVKDEATAISAGDTGVTDFFDNFFAGVKTTLRNHKFELEFDADTKGIAQKTKNALNDLKGLDDQGILNLGNIDGTKAQEDAYDSLCEVADQYHMEIEDLIPILVTLGLVQGEVTDKVVSFESVLSNLKTPLTNVSAAQEAFTAALEEQDAQGVVSAETLGKLIALDEDYIDCLEDSGGMLKLNADKFRELNQAKLEVAKTTAQEALSNTIWSAALSGNDAVDDEITKLAMLCNSYEYATSGYKAWLDAKSAPDVGSVFNQGKDALKALQDGLNSGEVGTNVFKGAQQFLIPQEVIDEGLQAVQNYIYDMQGYFKDGFAGVEYGWKSQV
ncbi:MAG: hypothetical protein RR900_08055, partial [Ruthenibacterium sp.]